MKNLYFVSPNAKFLVAALCFTGFALATVILSWYIGALQDNGIQSVLDRWGVVLPRISYMGGYMPAYAFFCSLTPVSGLLVRYPVSHQLWLFEQKVQSMGLPRPHIARCVICCCVCGCCCRCLDTERYILTRSSDVQTPGLQGRPPAVSACACAGCCYLPYVVMAMRPLFNLSCFGLCLLAIVSVSMDLGIHFIGAFLFFTSMITWTGCWFIVQRQAVAAWGANKARAELGIDLSSYRYSNHRNTFFGMVFIIAFDFIASSIAIWIGRTTGDWRFSTALYMYAGLSQWTYVALIAGALLNYAWTIDAWPAGGNQEEAVLFEEPGPFPL